MDKQTRVNKYKKFREEMKEEVPIDRQSIDEVDEKDDDFLAFIPKENNKNIEDTLMEPLSYETLEKDNEEVRHAIKEAKVNVGKEQYNTRLDILNKIKQEDEDYVPVHEYQTKDFSKGHVVASQPEKKLSLLEKLAAMSPEEDAEELKKYEEDLTVADLMSSNKPKKVKVVPQYVEEEEDDEEDEEENSKVVTILNYVIIGFIVIFIILVFFIVKQLLF